MFHAQPDGKRLRLHGKLPFFRKHRKRIPRAVPGCKNQLLGRHPYFVVKFNLHKRPVPGLIACQTGPETEFRTFFFHIKTHIPYDIREHIRPNVRSALAENLLRRSKSHKCLQHIAVPSIRIFYQRIQLSVRKGARTSFPELHIRGGVKNPLLPERLHIAHPLFHTLSALHYDGRQPALHQRVGTKKARRSRSGNHRARVSVVCSCITAYATAALCAGTFRNLINPLFHGHDIPVGNLFQNLFLPRGGNIHGEGIENLRLPARVDGFSHNSAGKYHAIPKL